FLREGEVTAALDHSGIVRVHGQGVHAGRPYLVYELIEGEDLERCFDRLDRDALLRITLEVAEALGYAHAQGVVHRDVKPANVLVDRAGRAHVADFGLAHAVGLERLTLSGVMLGTPRYMAPEQAEGKRERYGPPTDVWALGVLLYRVLTGREPFQGETLMLLVAQVTLEAPDDPRRISSGLPRGLVEVCLRALEKDPRRRYADGNAFAADLRRAIDGKSVEGMRPFRGRRVPLVAFAFALGAVACVVSVGALAWRLSRKDPASRAALATPERAPPSADLQRAALDAQRSDLARALDLLDAGDPAAELRLRRLRSDAARDPALAGALWSDGLAALQSCREPAALRARLPLLRELAELPPEARGAPSPPSIWPGAVGARLARELLERAGRTGAPPEPGQACEVLELLGTCGLRCEDPRQGVIALDDLLELFMVREIGPAIYWRGMLAGVRLDLPNFHGYLKPAGVDLLEPRPWGPEPSDPWARFLELRIQTLLQPTPERRAALLRALTDPEGFAEGPWELGPRQWASAAAYLVYANAAGEAARPIVERALGLDPENPAVHRSHAQLLRREGRFAEALPAIQEAIACYRRHYSANLHRRWTLRKMLEDLVRVHAALEDRDAARQAWRDMKTEGPEEAAFLAQEFPWLDEG
ncbi:MAG: protein kinase, partial [Planctomycetes bacterium]|nr:protein kinase [Planctomycetota bacterium]